MIDNICNFLTNKIRKSMPDVDDEKAEIINYGLQNIIGEIPKIFIVIAIGFLLGIGELTILTFLIITPYRMFAGGFHAKTHLGCITSTTAMYCIPALLSKYVDINFSYISIALIWIFGIIMISLYAPADTENVPILRKKDRKNKKILSYITFTVSIIIAMVIKNQIISNIIIISMFIQTLTITRLAYKITNNKYGYEIYNNQQV